jgi:hypothetical protein
LGAVSLGTIAALVPVPLAVAGSAVVSGLAAWQMQRIAERNRG